MSNLRRSRRFYGCLAFEGILVIAVIVILIFRIMDDDFKTQTITGVLIALGVLVISAPFAILIERMIKSRPELFVKERDIEGQERIRLRYPGEKVESDKRKSESPYASVEADSYQYKPRGRGKKPFTDFCLEEQAVCSICKLVIDNNTRIYRCPECQSPFHIEHLTEWLNVNSDCPVCKVELSL